MKKFSLAFLLALAAPLALAACEAPDHSEPDNGSGGGSGDDGVDTNEH